MEQMETTIDDEKTISLKTSILSRYDEVFRAHTLGLFLHSLKEDILLTIRRSDHLIIKYQLELILR